jgi:hypothetical protein
VGVAARNLNFPTFWFKKYPFGRGGLAVKNIVNIPIYLRNRYFALARKH